jgi:hypothetical protein
MDEKTVAGIVLVVVGLFGLALFFPIYSPSTYGGWGCPMMGRRGFGGMMGPSGLPYSAALCDRPTTIFLFDAVFLATLLLGAYLVWKSTKAT